MTTPLFVRPEGAQPQANAVRAYLTERDGLESSYSSERHCFEAEPTIARWFNGREQGYVVSLRDKRHRKQLNIAFFEHRNSDSICAVKWEQITINPPSVDKLPTGVYETKYSTTHSVGYGKAHEMADWIVEQLEDFWKGDEE